MKITLDACANCAAVGFVTLILIIATLLYVNNAFAEGKGDPHHDHEPVETYTVPTINLPDITINNYTQDNDGLGNALSAVSAISGLQSISLPNGGTGGSMSISKYDSYGGAFSLQHRYDDVDYNLNYGFSGGEEVITIGVGGRFR